VPGLELGFDAGDLGVAAVDSCSRLPAFLGDFLGGSPVAVESRLLAGQRLPTLDHDVNVLRVQLEAQASAFREFRRGERCAAAKERIFCGACAYVA
jgi:hypothetical protein